MGNMPDRMPYTLLKAQFEEFEHEEKKKLTETASPAGHHHHDG
jgi:hypothetical protein